LIIPVKACKPSEKLGGNVGLFLSTLLRRRTGDEAMTGKGNHVWQEERRSKLAEDRYGGTCECGKHSWARLTKGYVALVSPDDAARIQHQSYTVQFCRGKLYAAHVVTTNGKKQTRLLHRELLNSAPDQQTNFKNGNTFDCRQENIRKCARSEITHRQPGKKSCRTPFRGVRYHQDRWRAHIRYLGKTIYLGVFPFTNEGEVAAARAYDDGARDLFGEFAVLNFPRDGECSAVLGRGVQSIHLNDSGS
jgi:hypothetical protein